MKKLLVATAVIELGAGVALLAWPSQTVAALVGPSLAPPLAVVRSAGMLLLALGVANAVASRAGESRATRAVAVVMTCYNLLAATGLASAGIVAPPGGALLWPAVLLHAGMAVWCILCLRGPRVKEGPLPGGSPPLEAPASLGAKPHLLRDLRPQV